MDISDGWLTNITVCPSQHYDKRPACPISLLVIHNISLPPKQFGGSYIEQFFTGALNPLEHPYFAEISSMRVSAHCLIKRTGEIVQFVSFNDRAWHAGVSNYQGREKCNDFSIGIELEGADDIPYEQAQYQSLSQITQLLIQHYDIKDNIVGHQDIAPGRKTDPGEAFDWSYYYSLLK
ncbi:1,6-anhydro-N-acetylmuramyl-L-alanine amidase AmpD [Thalassotalea agarivorans]|uniref:1,6-anhydro-N-acetylmuramyl-L-alanine amidase AmpD n=1 Tax=Thalassotalea agarivorans TaxID=349064 RepID=A0A1I0AXS0_THASX|nr:1,6-anhydro-N-acetylmuramyl-L-alanine amidase AmpD [Thalassotalea agarivorans]SES99027.1 AmpD protein [Thalassotalea agarivorans]